MRRLIVMLITGFMIGVNGLAQEEGFSGRIAYIDSDFNVRVFVPVNDEMLILSDDASLTTADVRIYEFPTWSNDGRLAYFSSNFDSDGHGALEVYVSPDGMIPGEVVYSNDRRAITYAAWSPANCDETIICRDFAMLLSDLDTGMFVVESVRDGLTDARTFEIGRGAPFYFSWRGDGLGLIWHRDNTEVALYDILMDEMTTELSVIPGAFFAPAYAATGNQALYAEFDGSRSSRLQRYDGTNITTVISALTGAVTFTWSPDATQIALAAENRPLSVIDATSGVVQFEAPDSDILAYFWSPDGTKIAYITEADAPGTSNVRLNVPPYLNGVPVKQSDSFNGLVWSIWDITTDEVRRSPAFFPTRELGYLLTYFDQFAPSHRIWSPDSRALVYSRIDADGNSQIVLLDAAQAGEPAQVIAEGGFAVWSFGS